MSYSRYRMIAIPIEVGSAHTNSWPTARTNLIGAGAVHHELRDQTDDAPGRAAADPHELLSACAAGAAVAADQSDDPREPHRHRREHEQRRSPADDAIDARRAGGAVRAAVDLQIKSTDHGGLGNALSEEWRSAEGDERTKHPAPLLGRQCPVREEKQCRRAE